MLREAYEQEVLAIALRIVRKREENQEACITECELVVDSILAGQQHRNGFQRPSPPMRRLSDHQLKAATDTSAAYAMLIAIGVFAALKAADGSPDSAAYAFHKAVERRAELVQ